MSAVEHSGEAKRAVRSKQVSERCERISKRRSEWPNTSIWISKHSESLCHPRILPYFPLLLFFVFSFFFLPPVDHVNDTIASVHRGTISKENGKLECGFFLSNARKKIFNLKEVISRQKNTYSHGLDRHGAALEKEAIRFGFESRFYEAQNIEK